MKPKQQLQNDHHLLSLRVENAKLQEAYDELYKKYREKSKGKIEGINIPQLTYILKFHYEAGEVYINIKHDGNRFIGVEQSAINPLKDITKGLLPKLNE